ncbi:MAG TPA: ExeM/NucH family extracellular endonuclease [Candidatus Competibacter sp.]|nr:ExeM/NucH family extracellular endonuclease [Candidatus Competibacter sp.]
MFVRIWTGVGLALLAPTILAANSVFISEFHYDNAGTDTGEFIEITGPAGTDLTGWSVVLYNGSGGAVYDTDPLSGTIPDQCSGSGTVVVNYPSNGIQNGSPDGIALVDASGTVVQFLSYEGNFTAVGGPANGLTSTDIGVAESGSEPVGLSLQLIDNAWRAPAANTAGACNIGSNPPPPPPTACDLPATSIGLIQGSGADFDPAYGGQRTVRGVVVGDYEGSPPNLQGFYVQNLPAQADGDLTTSDAIFVFNGSNNSVSLGEIVQVTGTVSEFQNQTQLSNPTIVNCGTGSVDPVDISMPFSDVDALERFEGMLVRFPQTLFVTEHFQLGRFGQVVMSAGDRLLQPTNIALPGPDAAAVQAANDPNRIIVDDEQNNQNPDPIRFGRGGNPLSAANTLRGGDTATGLVGVMTYTWAGNSASGNAYRLRPINALNGGIPNFQPANLRPTAAPGVGGSLKVASFNVLNYFLTLDYPSGDLLDNTCGPSRNQECRGADSAVEFERQRAKLIAALTKLDADVAGLIELENTTGVDPLADIVDGLNAAVGSGTYAYIDTGTIGSDAIKVGLIYKPDAVIPVGTYKILDSSVDARFLDTKNRPVLAQAFQQIVTGEKFTAVVNHLKSKGSDCNDVGDPDQGDGQGNCNGTRTQAALALVDWLKGDPTGSGDPDVLILGDLNSYAKEDPVRVLEKAGYVNLAPKFLGTDAYSYAFDGQWGSLDHVLASASLAGQIAGAVEYHINADEPSVLDYNTEFKSANQQNSLYASDTFRVSDHDPVVVGLRLAAPSSDTAFSTFDVGRLNVNKRFKTSFLLSDFALSNGSNGIDPTTEPVKFTVANFTATIPVGSFRKGRFGAYTYVGTIDKVWIEVSITPLGNNRFGFQATAYGANLAGVANPVTVELAIGNDSGKTSTNNAIIR